MEIKRRNKRRAYIISSTSEFTITMVEGPSFQDLFANLLSELKNKDKVAYVSGHFSPAHNVDDMFSFLWGLEEAHQLLTPRIIRAEKSETKAEKLRAEGNKCYQKKLLDKALELYNQSIVFAPHPEIKIEKCSNGKISTTSNERQEDVVSEGQSTSCCTNKEEGYKALALGYANRSAVLYELGQYEKCICDIDYALLHGYPTILHSKLAERKAKCLIALQRINEAKSLIETSLQALDALALDEEKIKSSRANLQSLSQLDKKFIDIHPNTKYKLLFSFENPSPPKLAKCNPTIPSLSRSVDLAFSSTQGRYLVANKDIKPGDVIAVEDAYSKVVHLDSSLHNHCTECLARCLTPLPCPICSKVIFCSAACRMQALASYHGTECDILTSLATLDIGKNSVLACRIISQTTFTQLKNVVPVYFTESAEKPPASLGFDGAGKYMSSDYRTIYHLVGNKQSRSVSDLFKRCAMAFVLVKLLEQSSRFFVDAAGVAFTPSVGDIVLVGSTLFIHMMNLPCNAHSVTEFRININNYQQSVTSEIGCGAYGVMSLTNHSCNPAAARFTFGATEVLKAVRFIPAGTEVTDSYGEHYCVQKEESRIASLLQQYYFKCACEPCRHHWPTYCGLQEECMLKCVSCNNSIDLIGGKCPKCNLDYSKTSRSEKFNVVTYNWMEVIVQLKRIKGEFDLAYKGVIAGNNSSENINKLCEFIEFIDRYVQQPCKLYFEAQETLKHCFDRQASSCLVSP